MSNRPIVAAITALSAWLLLGCSASYPAIRSRLELKNDFCALVANDRTDDIAPAHISPCEEQHADSLLHRQFSNKEIRIANALGVTPLLDQWLLDFERSTGAGHADLLRINAQFQQRILLASDEIDAVAAGLRCEAERIRRIAAYLDDLEKKRTNVMTIGAVLAGTVTTLAPVFVSNQGVQNGVVIGGGTIATILGIAVIGANRKKVELTYQTSMLADIWYEREKSDVYPGFIWYMLTNQAFNPSDPQLSMEQNIRKRWLSIELAPSISQREEDLYFKHGGVFTEDQLTTLATLLDQMDASIRLLKSQVDILLKAAGRMMAAENDR
jgi:hypothetical protein